jgi:hypothetical protein
MSRPGPKPQPAARLSAAAIQYAIALEAERKVPKREWDRLVKAALSYQEGPRLCGRPRSAPAILEPDGAHSRAPAQPPSRRAPFTTHGENV